MDTIYERGYPPVFVCGSLAILIFSYGLGALAFYFIYPWLALVYLLVCAISLVAGMYYRCSHCCYHGKLCASGLGLVAGKLFKKQDPRGFMDTRNVIVPGILDIILLATSVLAFLYLLVARFSWINVLLFLFYLVMAVFFGFVMKKSTSCAHCNQGRIGCPAYDGMQGKKKL